MKLGLKARSLSSLEKTADKWFSLYIRLRDADENGMVKCVTCGKVAHYKEMDCGHFVTRNHKATRYSKDNCHPQDTFCNRYAHGEQYKHGQYIDSRYGVGFADFLVYIGKQPVKRKRTDYEFIIEYYRTEVKRLADKLGIKI